MNARQAEFHAGHRFMKPTIYMLAQKAGVSIATVSRAFNGHPRISGETKRRIFETAEAMAYSPSPTARNLANRTTETLAIVLPHITDPFFTELIRGAESVSKSRAYHLLIYTCEDMDEQNLFLQLLTTRIDGVVVAARSSTGQYVKRLARQNIPFVMLGGAIPGLHHNKVRPDNQSGAYQMTRHLIVDHHYGEIAFICGPEAQIHSGERLTGYLQALRDHGMAVRDGWVVAGEFTESSGFAGAKALLGLPRPPRAIFAGNDRMAIGAISAAAECGYAIPKDIAIVGFDDVPSSRYLRPALTTVNVNCFGQGAAAVEQLLDTLENPERPYVDLIMPAPVVLRNSCGCLERET